MHIPFQKAVLLATSLLAATSLALTPQQIVDCVKQLTDKTHLLQIETQEINLVNAGFQGYVRI